jgi:hypothetical protein
MRREVFKHSYGKSFESIIFIDKKIEFVSSGWIILNKKGATFFRSIQLSLIKLLYSSFNSSDSLLSKMLYLSAVNEQNRRQSLVKHN